MGNQQFKISDISDADSRSDLENRIEKVCNTQSALRTELERVGEQLNGQTTKLREEVEPKTISYLKCVHMGSLRRSLFYSAECDKAVEDMVAMAFNIANNMSESSKIDSLGNRIKKLDE